MNEFLWYPEELVEALNPLEIKGQIPPIKGVSLDSRSLVKEDLFIALPKNFGVKFHPSMPPKNDGHKYLDHAAAQGAAAALVAHLVDHEIPQIRVSNTLDGLWALAATARSRMSGKIIAITGSSGKTTLKESLKNALDCYANPGNLNNFLGLPLSMVRMPCDTKIGVFEMGMNHQNEIAPLARLAQPDIAIVINVLPVHLERLGSLDAIKKEKLSIAQGLNKKGILMVPDDLVGKMPWPGEIIRFGESPEADLRLLSDSDESLCSINFRGEVISFKLEDLGGHRKIAAAIALACGVMLDEDRPAIVKRLQKNILIKGRGNEKTVRGVTLIDESYNANPDSMALTLKNLNKRAVKGKKYAILGDMLELGAKAHQFHLSLADECAALTGVWLVGPLISELAQVLPKEKVLGVAATASELSAGKVIRQLCSGDVLMVKGSNKIFWPHEYVDLLAKNIEESKGLDN